MPEASPGASARERLAAGLEALGQTLEADGMTRLVSYVRLLARWNRAFNLSAVRDPDLMIARHLLDSLAIRPWLPAGRLLDIGSGAGLPGMVLAIAEPRRPVTLLDSNGKKTRFLEQVRLELRLDNVKVVRARAESAAGIGQFMVVTSRAYAELATFRAHAQACLAAGGCALAMKGRYPTRELAALTGEGVSWRVEHVAVPQLAEERHIVILM